MQGRGALERVDYESLKREALHHYLNMAPEKREAMGRAYVAGVRAIVYGTALAMAGVGVGVGVGLHLLRARRRISDADAERAPA